MSITYNTSIESRHLLHLLLLLLFCLINDDIVTNLNVFGELINWNSLVFIGFQLLRRQNLSL